MQKKRNKTLRTKNGFPQVLLLLSCGLLSLGGCAHSGLSRTYSEKALFDNACLIPKVPSAVSGDILARLDEPNLKGQFPASVSVKNSKSLILEVSTLLGGTLALLEIDGDSYSFRKNAGEKKSLNSSGRWRGIPIQYAVSLFLGKLPCPESSSSLRFSVSKDVLKVESDDAYFVYHYIEYESAPWVDELSVKEKSTGKELKMEFSRPENGTRVFLSWRVESDSGSLFVKWRNREIN